jgi:hypothetical protein
MIAYKLLRVRKDGTLGPLFINASMRIPMDRWLPAQCHPTNGFAVREGWHCMFFPSAPHLEGTKSAENRRWYRVEIRDFTEHERPAGQGGTWYTAGWMRVLDSL